MSANDCGLWGQAAMGMPPQRLAQWRTQVAKTNGWQKGRSSCDLVFQRLDKQNEDPFFKVKQDQLMQWIALVRALGRNSAAPRLGNGMVPSEICSVSLAACQRPDERHTSRVNGVGVVLC